jgi:hypothetical protein
MLKLFYLLRFRGGTSPCARKRRSGYFGMINTQVVDMSAHAAQAESATQRLVYQFQLWGLSGRGSTGFVTGPYFSRAANAARPPWVGRDGFQPIHLSPEGIPV